MTAIFRAFSAVILAVVAVAGVSAQTHHFVGGDDGWIPEMNVSSWLAGRVFKVGDKLWFKNSGAEGILEVRGPEELEACDFKNPIEMYTDHVALEEQGVRYFVSGNLQHCKNGLKLPVPIVADPEPFWPRPTNQSPGFEPVKPDLAPPDPFEPVKPDLAPPEPYWPAPGAFPPGGGHDQEPPFGPYDPPVKPIYPPPQEPSYPPPPSDAIVVEGAKMMMIVGLLIGCVVGV